jgi:enoyl-CoA hydratase
LQQLHKRVIRLGAGAAQHQQFAFGPELTEQIGQPVSVGRRGVVVDRLGLTKAKEYALTGKALTGSEAAEIELINQAVPFADLESTVADLAAKLASVPLSQLSAMKIIVNQAYDNMGLASTQTLGPILDGLMRNTPDALRFIGLAETEGVRSVITERDGLFGDYSQAPPERQPNPEHVIMP